MQEISESMPLVIADENIRADFVRAACDLIEDIKRTSADAVIFLDPETKSFETFLKQTWSTICPDEDPPKVIHYNSSSEFLNNLNSLNLTPKIYIIDTLEEGTNAINATVQILNKQHTYLTIVKCIDSKRFKVEIEKPNEVEMDGISKLSTSRVKNDSPASKNLIDDDKPTPSKKELSEQKALLIRKAQSGDKDAIEKLFESERLFAFKVAIKITSNKDEAEDLVQKSILKGMQKLKDLTEPKAFGAWYARIIRHVFIDEKRLKRITTFSLDSPTTESTGTYDVTDKLNNFDIESHSIVESLRENLHPDYFDILICIEVFKLSYAEYGELKNIPVGTVRSRLHSAKRKARLFLED